MRSRSLAGLLVGLPILLLILFTLGGLTDVGDVGLPSVPVATLLGLPVDLWVRDLATAVTVGALLVALLAPQPIPAVRRLALVGGVVWLAALGGQLLLTVSEIFALPWSRMGDASTLRSSAQDLVGQTDLGRVMVAQATLVLMALLLASLRRHRSTSMVALGLGIVAAWLPGLTGHAGMDHGHVAATISLGLHVVGASLWVGGLIAVAVQIGGHGSDPALVLRRFSLVAVICVVVIAETGLLNASLRLDGLASLVTSPYGAIILAKVSILIVLIGWGLRHREALATAWSARTSAVLDARERAFQGWVAWEVMWMGAVYGLSIALSRTAPPGVALAGDRLSLGSIVLLLLGIPIAVAFAAPAVTSCLPRLRTYPEPVAVGALVAIAVVSTWQTSAVAVDTVGVQIAALVSSVVLIGCGLLVVPAIRDSAAAAVIMMVGLPVVAWWLERDVPGGLGVGTWSTVLLAEGLVAWCAFRRGGRGTHETIEQTPTRQEVAP